MASGKWETKEIIRSLQDTSALDRSLPSLLETPSAEAPLCSTPNPKAQSHDNAGSDGERENTSLVRTRERIRGSMEHK